MFLFFKPIQSLQGAQLLDPDGFNKSFDEVYEELLAAEILKARQQDIIISEKIDKPKLIQVLQRKLKQEPAPDELFGDQRKIRAMSFLLMLLMDD